MTGWSKSSACAISAHALLLGRNSVTVSDTSCAGQRRIAGFSEWVNIRDSQGRLANSEVNVCALGIDLDNTMDHEAVLLAREP